MALRLLEYSLICRDSKIQDLLRDIPGKSGMVGSYVICSD